VGTTSEAATATVARGPIVAVEIDVPIRYVAWPNDEGLINVQFVARVTNTGNVPVEIYNIEWAQVGEDGELLDPRSLDRSSPQRIAVGGVGVLAGSGTGITATSSADIEGVNITFEAREAASPDRLLVASKVELDRDIRADHVRVVGEVENPTGATVDSVLVEVVLLDSAGRWIGSARAEIEDESLGAGESAEFTADARLPPGIVAEVDSVLVFAFAE
jgi:hypothetical protein